MPLDELRAKALAKSQAFAALTAAIAGQRQALEDAIRAADSLDALTAIVIAYHPPAMADAASRALHWDSQKGDLS